jgi:hypothetical protein
VTPPHCGAYGIRLADNPAKYEAYCISCILCLDLMADFLPLYGAESTDTENIRATTAYFHYLPTARVILRYTLTFHS